MLVVLQQIFARFHVGVSHDIQHVDGYLSLKEANKYREAISAQLFGKGQWHTMYVCIPLCTYAVQRSHTTQVSALILSASTIV